MTQAAIDPARVAAAMRAIGIKLPEAVDIDPPRDPGTVGAQTLADLPFGPAPKPLVGKYISPEGVTMVYALGGVGKGWAALYWALQLVRAGKVVTILDFEGHPNEWARRSRMMGFTGDELKKVHYRAPYREAWTAKRGTLYQTKELIRADLDVTQTDVVIIDSYSTSCSNGAEMGGIAAATEFFKACEQFGRPVVVIAHIASGGERFPDKAFGSIQIRNQARSQWAVAKVGDDDEGGNVHLELCNTKQSEGQKTRNQFMNFTFDLLQTSVVVDEGSPKNRATWSWIYDVLNRALRDGITVKRLAAVIVEDGGPKLTEKVLRLELGRKSEHFEHDESAPFKWSIRGRRKDAPAEAGNDGEIPI